MRYTTDLLSQMENLLNIGIALSAEKDQNKLLEMILTEARKVTNADAGTLFLCEGNHLIFKIMQNETLQIFKGGQGEEINLPPVIMETGNVASYVAMNQQSVNIPDVYSAEGFDFSGPKRYDLLMNYRTVSMLVTPLVNQQGNVFGVLQLINARNPEGKVIPFAAQFEKVVTSLASQAAISLSNAQFLEEVERLLHSFVEVMATAIDARSPYNANHTRRVAKMVEAMALEINRCETGRFGKEFFDKGRLDQLVMAAWLHDIGKIATPCRVMDKATRLEESLSLILQRFEYIAVRQRLEYLERSVKCGKYTRGNAGSTSAMSSTTSMEDWYAEERQALELARDLVLLANNPLTVITPGLIERLRELAHRTYVDERGDLKHWLTSDELAALSVSHGTLTPLERRIMEDHVEISRRILEVIPFPETLKNVRTWAVLHHEFLDGSGYPRRFFGDEIPLEGRILTLIDVFDALTASDRPYKKAISLEESLAILEGMVKKEKLDAHVYEIFVRAKIWECVQELSPQEQKESAEIAALQVG